MRMKISTIGKPNKEALLIPPVNIRVPSVACGSFSQRPISQKISAENANINQCIMPINNISAPNPKSFNYNKINAKNEM